MITISNTVASTVAQAVIEAANASNMEVTVQTIGEATRKPRAPKPSDAIVRDMKARMVAAFRGDEELQQEGVATDWEYAITTLSELIGIHPELKKIVRLVLDDKIGIEELKELAAHAAHVPEILEADEIEKEIREEARREAEAARIARAEAKLAKLKQAA